MSASSPERDARILVLVRHAKAEQHDESGDHERRLTGRGRRDAAALGRYLAGEGLTPDAAVVSTAQRARETWVQLARAAGTPAEADLSEEMYGADADEILERLREVPATRRCVAFVGHNPSVEDLASRLSDGAGPTELETQLRLGMPTSAVAAFDVTGPWQDLSSGTCRIRAFHVGRS